MNTSQTKSSLTLALIQYSMVWENDQATRDLLDEMLAKQLTETPDVIILPESFNTGFSMQPERVAETMDGASVRWMQNLAETSGSAVCASLFIKENGQFLNRFLWIESGKEMVSYDKRHLFSMGNEHLHYTPGKQQVLIDYKGWKIFPQICYDLRFPVWSRNTFSYDLLINVANWPATRRKVWKTLLKARAIENQCYVAAVSRVGMDGTGLDHAGKSMVIDPKGQVLLNAGSKPGVMTLSIDLDERREFLRKFNALNDADGFTLQA
ncbi:MAG: amidohydrolase [Prolixibacteraceae bacterium]|nr:amidohydrolase [Prolixibacteraceae bacterium]